MPWRRVWKSLTKLFVLVFVPVVNRGSSGFVKEWVGVESTIVGAGARVVVKVFVVYRIVVYVVKTTFV